MAVPSQLTVPEGFIYRPEFITPAHEQDLADRISRLEFSEVRMHGIVAKRRVAHFGLNYEYETFRVTPGPPLPEFLQPLQRSVAELTQRAPDDFGEVLVTEYPTGAGIGWHRDALSFDIIVGVSLLGRCRMRLRPMGATGRGSAADVILEPRSAYVLSGSARTAWQHSIPASESLRYSITFRTLRKSSNSSRPL